MSGIICRTRRILKLHHELLECALPLGHGHPTPFGRPAEPKRGRGIGTKFHKLHVIHPSPLPPHVEQIWKQICEWFPCIRGPYTKEGKSVTGKQCQLRKRCTNYVSSMEPPAGSRRVKGSTTIHLQLAGFFSISFSICTQITGMFVKQHILNVIGRAGGRVLPTGTASKRLLEI